MTQKPARPHAFTLIELLVVVAIIAVLIGLLLPAVQKVRDAATRAQCQSQLKQLVLALHHYHDTEGHFPAGGVTATELSWHVYVLPYVEQNNLYERFSFSTTSHFDSANGTGPGKNENAANRIALFLCPASPADRMQMGDRDNIDTPELIGGTLPPYTTHYYGVMGPKGVNPTDGSSYGWTDTGDHGGFATQGVLGKDTQVAFRDVTDGTSNTFALGEISWVNPRVGSRYRSWVRGSDSAMACGGCRNVASAINTPSIATFNDIAFGSQHTGGANFALTDGSVRFVNENIALGVYKATASRNGGEVASID